MSDFLVGYAHDECTGCDTDNEILVKKSEIIIVGRIFVSEQKHCDTSAHFRVGVKKNYSRSDEPFIYLFYPTKNDAYIAHKELCDELCGRCKQIEIER